MKKLLLVTLPIIFLTLSLIVWWQTRTRITEGPCCGSIDSTGELEKDATLALFEGRQIRIPEILLSESVKSPILGVSTNERYIEVDLSEQKLRAWDGNQLFLESLVSTGLPWWPTPQGEFRIWLKLRATRMEGGSGKYYYNLPNVPYVMFFEGSGVPNFRGYGLHGTYWHNDFGRVHSHGCINLPTLVAEKLYFWTSPQMPEGKSVIRATSENLGTRIIIHE